MFWGPSWESCTLTLHRYLFCLPIVIFSTHYGPTFLQGVSQCLHFPHLVWVMGVYTLNSQMKQKRPQCANGCLVQKTKLELRQSKTSKWCAAQALCLSTKSWSPVTPPFWLNQIQPSVTNPDSSPTWFLTQDSIHAVAWLLIFPSFINGSQGLWSLHKSVSIVLKFLWYYTFHGTVSFACTVWKITTCQVLLLVI